MKRIKVSITVCLIFLSCAIISSCEEPGPCYWPFQFANLSTDTVGIAVLENYQSSQDNSYHCMGIDYPILPLSTISSDLSYFYGIKGDNTPWGDSWNYYFSKAHIDTLCIVVYKNSTSYLYGENYELPNDSDILKIYKFDAKDPVLNTMISPTFTYP